MINIYSESNWLFVLGQEDKARKVMKKLGSSDTTIEERIKNYRQLNEAHKNANFWQSIKQPQVWQRLLIIYGLFTLQAFSGGCVSLYKNILFFVNQRGEKKSYIRQLSFQNFPSSSNL